MKARVQKTQLFIYKHVGGNLKMEKKIDILRRTISRIEENVSKLPFDEIIKNFNNFKTNGPEILRKLSQYGWFIDKSFTISEILTLENIIESNNEESLNQYFSNYYHENVRNIEHILNESYPNRKKIFNEAFGNYKEEKYTSSITLFLTQIDGICYDKMEKMFFTNDKKLSRKQIYKPEVTEKIMNASNELMKLLLSPINESTLINEHSENVRKFPVRLNRNEIIHGIDISYGTKINNLKIISLINYIADILKTK